MMDMQSEFLIDMVSNAPFLAFLLWQYKVMRSDYKEAQKEMRELQQKNQAEMKELREKAKAEEEKIRERWEGVVAKLDSERKDFMAEGVTKMNHIEKEVDAIKAQTDKIGHIEKDAHATKKAVTQLSEEMKDIRYTAFEIVNALAQDKKTK